MLEIKGLTKIYRSKTGDEVRALDNVDVSFPETGMVFVLGKSGSGKSTLLNIMGGLDSYDGGEFIIKGKSSRNFAGSDFDAYRNTFIGFIFQEYNVLDDFTVGANIGLALELQGKKATPEAIVNILDQVELTNFARRKPNELSGGQKQRVAIARALVKDPQIIMADEPTGALDSTTGKQIFDTLKSLSKTKLVLVVSHDRDFAERYADRIIELADGKIISDVTRHEHDNEKVSAGIDKIGGSILRIKAGYKLTAVDLEMINKYLAENQSDVLLSGDNRVNDELRSVAGISESGATAVFEKTDAATDYTLKKYEKKDSHFIRSRLPIKDAVRIGASGLKHKRFRLIMTIFLSLIAFTMFGFADTLASYQKFEAAVDSLADSNIRNASVSISVLHTWYYGDGDIDSYYQNSSLNDQDIEYLKNHTGLNFVPVFTGSRYSGGFDMTRMMKNHEGGNLIYTGRLHGLVTMDEAALATVGLQADAGRLPTAEGEIAITELMYRQFNEYGFIDAETNEEVEAGKLTMAEDGSANSILGKHLYIRSNESGANVTLKVVGVVDTHFNYERYEAYLPSDKEGLEEGNLIEDMVMYMEIESELDYGFHALGFAHEDDIATLSKNSVYKVFGKDMSNHSTAFMELLVNVTRLPAYEGEDDLETYEATISRVAKSDVISDLTIVWLDGERTTLGKNEIILPLYMMDQVIPRSYKLEIDYSELDAFMTDKYGDAWATQDDYSGNLYDKIYHAANQIYGESLNYDSAKIAEKLQTDVYPFFLEHLGITLPADDMTLHAGVHNALESIIYSMVIEDNKISAEIYDHTIIEILRDLYADYAVCTFDLAHNAKYLKLMSEHSYGTGEEYTEEDLLRNAIAFYSDCYIVWEREDYGYYNNEYGMSGSEITLMAKELLSGNNNTSAESLSERFTFTVSSWKWGDEGDRINTGTNVKNYTVVGFYEAPANYYIGEMAISETLNAEFEQWYLENMNEYSSYEEVAEHDEGIWAYAIAPMTKDRAMLEKLVSMSYEEGVDLRFQLENYIMDTLDSFNEFIEIGAQVFFYVGLSFAIFSALLLMNFIATSISYKKREIGILRAVGARSSDVFKIFFSEALIIALINFTLSTAAVIAGILVANNMMHNEGITVTLLSYGVRQFALMLAVSVGVAIVASFLPVNRIARKKPVDAIKDR